MYLKGSKNLKIAAVIAEYNPFTKGHAYHIEETKRVTGANYVLCLMSGNFIQRGGPAVLDKYTRTHMALAAGADAVFELPTGFCTQSAELFAFGGVALADKMGADVLSFGSEAPLALLSRVASLLANESEEFQQLLKEQLAQKRSFARARTAALTQMLSLSEEECDLLCRPNAILAIEYLKKITELNSAVTPVTVFRYGSDYNNSDPTALMPSATAIREVLADQGTAALKDMVPQPVFQLLEGATHFASAEQFFPLIKYKALQTSPEEARMLCGSFPGLEHLITGAVYDGSFDEMVQRIHSKHLTRAAVRRLLFNLLFGITKDKIDRWRNDPRSLYLRLLGFRRSAAPAVAEVQRRSAFPVITNVPAYQKAIPEPSLFETDLFAGDLYQLITKTPDCSGRPDFVLKPVILNDR